MKNGLTAKKLLSNYLTAVIFLGTTGTATATAAASFDGPYVQGTFGFAKGETRLQDFNPDTTISDHSPKGVITLGYSKSFGLTNLSATAFGVMGRVASGTIRGDDFSGPWQDDFHLKRIWGVAIEPGIYLAPKTLAYAKIGYVHARGTNRYDYDGSTDSGVASHSHRGLGFGVGLRQAYSAKTDLVFEVQQAQFSSARYWEDTRESYRPSLIMISLGAAIRF